MLRAAFVMAATDRVAWHYARDDLAFMHVGLGGTRS